MSKTILISGGARSGKSTIAERCVTSMSAHPIYIATAQSLDNEMQDRITRHQSRRGPEWTTMETPINLSQALIDTDGKGARLVDCLTLWLSNLMLGDHDWHSAVKDLAETLKAQADPVVIVTNEVGAGIVPDNALARDFRDAAGFMNQIIAQAADEVYLAVCGLPMKVKPNDSIPF